MKDSLELEVSPTDYLLHSPEMRATIEKYSYIDERGTRIVSWDFAKYVNHCCACNTISTGYGFEIAIRDIGAGEQITDEYGVFNLTCEMEVACGRTDCRKIVRPSDFESFYHQWDTLIRDAIPLLLEVEQPLLALVDQDTRHELDELQREPDRYKSVYALRHHT